MSLRCFYRSEVPRMTPISGHVPCILDHMDEGRSQGAFEEAIPRAPTHMPTNTLSSPIYESFGVSAPFVFHDVLIDSFPSGGIDLRPVTNRIGYNSSHLTSRLMYPLLWSHQCYIAAMLAFGSSRHARWTITHLRCDRQNYARPRTNQEVPVAFHQRKWPPDPL